MCMPSRRHRIVDFLDSRRMETAPIVYVPRFFYVQLKVSQTSHLIYVVLWAPRHDIAARFSSAYGTWQSQAVTHPVMNRARSCLTSVIEPTPMRQRRISYKSARIVPLYKKTSKSEPRNYRLVSILTVMSKNIETTVYKQLENHLTSKKVLYDTEWT